MMCVGVAHTSLRDAVRSLLPRSRSVPQGSGTPWFNYAHQPLSDHRRHRIHQWEFYKKIY